MSRQPIRFPRFARGLTVVSVLCALGLFGQACAPADEPVKAGPSELQTVSLIGRCTVERANIPVLPEHAREAATSTAAVGPSADHPHPDGLSADHPHPDGPIGQKGWIFGVLLHEGPREFRAVRRQTLADFEQSHSEFTADGYYLRDFEIVEEGAETLVSGLWHPGSVAQRLDLGSTRQVFLGANAAAAAAGFRPADIEIRKVQGVYHFATLWNSDQAGNLLTVDIDRDQVKEIVQNGSRIVDLEPSLVNGGQCYTVIHEPVSVVPRVFLGQTRWEFDATAREQFDSNRQPVELEIENANGVAHYSTSWEPAAGASWLVLALSESAQNCRVASLRLGTSGLQPFDYTTCGGSLDHDAVAGIEDAIAVVQDATVATETATAAPPEMVVGSNEISADIHDLERPLPSDLPVLHVVDFVVTRRDLVTCLQCFADHSPVLHDMGSSGPP